MFDSDERKTHSFSDATSSGDGGDSKRNGRYTYSSGRLMQIAVRVLAFALVHAWLVYAAWTNLWYEGTTVLWPAAGLALATLLIEKTRRWPLYLAAIAVSLVTIGVLRGTPLAPTVAYAVLNMLDPLVGATLVRRLVGDPFRQGRLRDVVAFVTTCCLGSAVLSATLGAAITVYWFDAPSYWVSWIMWWASVVGGVLVITPFLMVWLGTRWGHVHLRDAIELVIVLGLLAFVSRAVFDDVPLAMAVRPSLAVLLVGLLAWTAFRFELRGTTALVIVLGVVTLTYTIEGHGSFARVGTAPLERVVALQGYVSAVALVSLLVGTAVAERRVTHRRFRDVIDNSNALIFAKRIDGRYLFVNRRFEQLFHTTHRELLGKTDHDIWPKEMADAYRARDEEVIIRGEASVVEEIIPQDDGLHTYLSVKFPLRDQHGTCYAVCGIATDITDRKRAELRLQASESQYRSVIEAALDAIVIVDEHGQIIEWNPQAEHIFGWTKSEAVGRLLQNLVSLPEHSAAQLRGLEHQFETDDGPSPGHRMELTAQVRSGVSIPIELTVTPQRSEAGQRFCAFIRDISERKAAEHEITDRNRALAVALSDAKAATVRATLLAEVTSLLSSTPGYEYEAALTELTRACARSLGDWAVIDLLDGGDIRRLAGAHRDPEKSALLAEMAARYPPRTSAFSPARAVFGTRTPISLPSVSEDELCIYSVDTEHARILHELGTRSVVIVPMLARDQLLGALAMASATPERYRPADVELIAELAYRAAVMIDNRRLRMAELRAHQQMARLALAVRDAANTPLQSLLLDLEMLGSSAQTSGEKSVVARMRRSVDRLRLLDHTLSAYSYHVPLNPGDEAFDAMRVLEELVQRDG